MQVASVLLGQRASLSGTTALGAVIATVLASGLAGLVLWGRQRIRGEELAREQAQRLAAEAELRLLRAQLEPHMLFNTLANLRELVAEDPPAAQRMLDSFIVFLRGALAASRSERTTLAEEFALLRAYLGLMGVRMGNRLAWRLTLPDELAGTMLPPMVLQPLVENAIKHGLEPQVGPGSIEVSAERAPGAVVVTVTDTGQGLRAPAVAAASEAGVADASPEAPSHAAAGDTAAASRSYGIHHVRERLRAAFGPAATLQLQPHSAPHGVRAIVRIPA
jgi:sensor histidine kinase YesM